MVLLFRGIVVGHLIECSVTKFERVLLWQD